MANLRIKRQRVFSDSGSMVDLFQPRPEVKRSESNSRNECSCCNFEESTQDPFEKAFEKAWKAIEDGEIFKLKQAIQEMKKSETGPFPYLDTHRRIERGGVTYSMSLLALCGFHGRKDMVDLLLKEGADMKAKSTCRVHTGTPICQLMLHCLVQKDYERLNPMLEYFIQKGAQLSGEIAIQHVGPDHSDSGGFPYGMLDLPLSMQRVDCAKILVKAGVDLINGGSPGGEKFAVVPMFQEYRDHGTNEFIHWAFNEYIPQHPEIDLERFAQRIIQSIINMKDKDRKRWFWQSVQRAPAHAILTSHHKETILHLVQCGKEIGLDLLAEKSSTHKTALHVAAEDNDVESIHLLLQLEADTRATDNSDMNPFMIAVEKGHLEVVKAMMKKDPGLVSLPMGSGSTVIHWALEKGHHRNAFFKGCSEENPKILLATDSQGNTIAHLVTASGNTDVFEMLWSKEFAETVFSNRNLKDKTPLELAVEKGHVNILNTLKKYVDRGTNPIAPLWHHKLKTDWWSKVTPCFLYAASCGSLDTVKYFIDNGLEPSIRHNGKTPLLCAAEAGHDEIVAYLLQFRKVWTDLENQPEKVYSASASPLLMAAQNGYTRCVTHLLQKGANMLQRDSEDRNCLTIAIQNHHKATTLAILSVKNGLEALKTSPTPQQLLWDRTSTPLQLLIKEMPDLAEYVLNKCITQAGEDQPVKYNFDILEDQVPHKHHDHYTLVYMIEHNRMELLQHPLVENVFFKKFWVKTFPLFVFKLLLYCLFLVALNIFVVVIPRPGPDSETCQSDDDSQTLAATPTIGQNGDAQRFLAAAAITLCILSLIGLLVEFLQLANRGLRYFKDPDNYFQLALYTLTLIFIVSLVNGNDNWCSTPGQWQIGAFAVFLSWVNLLFILKYISYTAGPINMFLSICFAFLKLIFLPIMLILAFGIPFYMVFVKKSESLAAFTSPSQAIAKTFVQLAGEFDFEAVFNQGALLYTPATYILFFTFLITVPILFSNLLNALAVGEPLEKFKKTELTTHHLWMRLILEQGWMKGLYTYGHCKAEYSKGDDSSRDPTLWSENLYFGFVLAFYTRGCSGLAEFLLEKFEKGYSVHAKIAKALKKKNEEICSTVMNPISTQAQKPVREDDIVASYKLLQKRSGEVLPVCHEAAVQTHAESTAMIAGSIRGVEIIGEVEFRVLHQGGSFPWRGYGLRLDIPKGSFPPDMGECRINIRASLSGQFQLPEDSDLISPVFWISASCEFTKPVTLEIQHCALREDEAALSSLSFVSAKCSQRDLPYQFRQVEGGVFTIYSSYGSIQLNHFSGFAVTARKGTLQSYCAYLFHTVEQMYDWKYYFVITQDLDTKNMIVREHYGHFAKQDATVRVRFSNSEITLDIPETGLVTGVGWRITPFSHPTISRSDVDQCEPGQWIPECQLIVQWEKDDQKPVRLRHKVELIGASAPYNFIYLILNPATAPRPNMKDLMDALYHKKANQWKEIGIQLNISNLSNIETKCRDPKPCLLEMLEVWLKRVDPPPTWSDIIAAVEFLGDEQLGKELREKYLQ